MKRGGWLSAVVQASQSMYPRRNCKTPGKSAALHACGDKECIFKSNPEYPANVIPNQRTHTGKRALMKGGTDASLKQAILPTEYNAKKCSPSAARVKEISTLLSVFECSKGQRQITLFALFVRNSEVPCDENSLGTHTQPANQRAESSSEAR